MLDLALLVLLAVAVLCSIIELGLSAHVVSVLDDAYFSYHSSTLNYVVFASLWSLVVSAFLLIWGAVAGSRNHSARWAGPLTLALNALTMIFWLAGFASLASYYGGYTPTGELGALLAFAVILWLIFLAILIINCLTAFGVVKSDRVGHSPLFNGSRSGANKGPAVTTNSSTV